MAQNRRHDEDVKQMTPAQLRREVMKLRRAIRKHRDADENARCWHNDLVLYAALGEEVPAGTMSGPEDVLLQNCRRYIRQQQWVLHGCRYGS
jgi:hypothetical protein